MYILVNEKARCNENYCWVLEIGQIKMNEFLIKNKTFLNYFTKNVYGSSPCSPKPKQLISLSIYFLVK
jgi:hypothetical protein